MAVRWQGTDEQIHQSTFFRRNVTDNEGQREALRTSDQSTQFDERVGQLFRRWQQ